MMLTKNSIHIIPAIIISCIILVITFYVNRFLQKTIVELGKKHEIAPQIINAIRLVSKFFIYSFGLILILENLHIQISTLFGTFGIVAVGIGLAVQNTMMNVTSGILILYYKPFFIGDFISINTQAINDNIQGLVTDITLMNTEVTYEKKKIIIPNSLISSSVITVHEKE